MVGQKEPCPAALDNKSIKSNRKAGIVFLAVAFVMIHQSDAAGLNVATPLSSSPSRPTQIGRITAVQARMARAALGLPMAKVAAATGCTKMTLSRFENGGALSGKTNSSIRNFYESHGVQFSADAYYHAVRSPK